MGYEYGDVNPEYVGRASSRITELFIEYFVAKNLTYDLTEFNGRSDYGPFLDFGIPLRLSTDFNGLLAGIPAGGLDTGADGIKTMEERRSYGGMQHLPGSAYDYCVEVWWVYSTTRATISTATLWKTSHHRCLVTWGRRQRMLSSGFL